MFDDEVMGQETYSDETNLMLINDACYSQVCSDAEGATSLRLLLPSKA